MAGVAVEAAECPTSCGTKDGKGWSGVMTAPLNLIVASLKQTAARCRVLETAEPVTLRATGL